MLEPLFALLLAVFAVSSTPAADIGQFGIAALWILAFGFFGWQFTVSQVERHLLLHPGVPYHEPAGLKILNFIGFTAVLFLSPFAGVCVAIAAPIPALPTLLAFFPYALNHLLRSLALYRVERQVQGREWSLAQFLVYRQRLLFVSVVPILLLTGLRDAFLLHPRASLLLESYGGAASALLSLLLLLVIFALSPLIVRHVLGARPLPAGPLRDRLSDYGVRTGFRPNEILVWPTGNTVTNAMFVGVLPFLKYIILTDGLLRAHDPQAVEAVYAHEAGHGRRRHTALYLLLVCGFTLVMTGLELHFEGWFGERLFTDVWLSLAQSTLSVLSLTVFILVGLGWLSRRFEVEADLYAAETLKTPEPLFRALLGISHRMGIPVEREGFRHFGIASRFQWIQQFQSDEQFRMRFLRMMRRARLAIVGIFVLGVLLIALQYPRVRDEGAVRALRTQAVELEERGQIAEAVEAYEKAIDHAAKLADEGRLSRASRHELALLASLGDLHLQAGDSLAATRVAERMEKRQTDEEDVFGQYNIRNLRLLLGVLDGTATSEAVRSLIADLDALVASQPVDPGSAATTYGDLFLALRASGDRTTEAPGRPGDYVGAARLLDAYEQSGRYALVDEWLVPAAKDLKKSALRRQLLRAVAALPPEIVAILREASEGP
jgi:Zn-dependent protease with chaperone function